MAKTVALYDLAALVTDDLTATADGIAEAVGRNPAEVVDILTPTAPRYRRGEITQTEHWEDVAFRLGLDDTELLADFALASAHIDSEILGRIRVQAGIMTLGLISDATPDWVGHYRRILKLDELFNAHIIGSELDEEQTYSQLLATSATRLQATAADVTFIDRKPVHLETATALGMPTINLGTTTDYKSAFSVLT